MKKYKVVFKMSGGTIIKTREFEKPSAVVYCLSQALPNGTSRVCVEDLSGSNDTKTVHYEVSAKSLSVSKIKELKTFLGIAR